MQKIRKASLICSFLAFSFCLYAQDSTLQSDLMAMILEAEAQFDRDKALANIGEIPLEEGLWQSLEPRQYGGELLAFEGVPQQAGVELVWTTASEWNSQRFVLERQLADQSFVIISMLDAGGVRDQLTYYQYLDEQAQKGENVYRLRQIDQNGVSHVCPPISVTYGEGAFLTLLPSSDFQYLAIQTDIKMVHIKIKDQKGNVLVKTEKDAVSFARIDIDSLKPGLYEVFVEDGDQVRVMQFEKKKKI